MDRRSTPITGRQPSRRNVLRLGLATPLALSGLAAAAAPATATAPATAAAPAAAPTRTARAVGTMSGSDDAVSALEQAYDTTIGLAARNLDTGARLIHRAADRFPMLSVFKTLAVAAVLRDHDEHGETLRRRVWYPPADVLEYAPVAAEHVDTGMTVAELCDATLRLSDNTAANLLLREIGGPRGLTAFIRSIGDHVTRLDRWEPDLNTAVPGDERDTTTPAAIARAYAGLLTGTTLSRPDRNRLTSWMLDNQTSDTRFRAGLPRGWRLADKTGSGAYGTNNDVGVAWSPDGTPVVIAALSRRDRPDATGNDEVLAELARLVVDRIG
ncbi:class A beta-lactamase [Jiangella gansuensis]|uniref:class A beta-lactamase n=1 Tax=Jiangella gansuensis TaxID=281473 RepID=UPI00047897AC|nr:class A beta-lactamase [Jiangella gansuensis]